MPDGNLSAPDIDAVETREWIDSLDSVVKYDSQARAEFILKELLQHAKQVGVPVPAGITTPYLNTIPADQEARFPKEDYAVMGRLTDYMRWNVLAMVIRAGHRKEGLGGHISTYASIATLFEVGLNYFLKADDLVFFQGHSSEGIYARAFF